MDRLGKVLKSNLAVSVLVHFHAANTNIPSIWSFIKGRGLIDSQFCVAGEASGNLQSWWKGKQAHLT